MKLPWNKKYISVSFHVILTIAIGYALYLIINLAYYSIANFAEVTESAGKVIGRFFSIFAPIITAFVIWYLLEPVVEFFQKKYEELFGKKRRVSRMAGTTAAYVCILIIFLSAAAAAVLSVGYGKGGQAFIDAAIDSINRLRNDLGEFYAEMVLRFNEWGIAEFFTNTAADLIVGITRSIPENAADMLASAGSFISSLLLGFVIAFYFLKDKERIKISLNRVFNIFVPVVAGSRVRRFLREADAVFSGYIRGQLMDAAIMGTLFSVVLSLIGVKFSILIGIFAGLSNIVPYVGAIVAFVIAVTVAFILGSPAQAVYAGLAMLVLQQIDATIVIPRVIGKKVELSPVLVIVSITVGGKLFGVTGMIFAVPVCAMIKIFLVRYINSRSPL